MIYSQSELVFCFFFHYFMASVSMSSMSLFFVDVYLYSDIIFIPKSQMNRKNAVFVCPKYPRNS